MKKRDVLTLLIPSLIVVILWVIFSVYHNFVSSTIPVSVNAQISQINPDFDLQTIQILKNRSTVNPIYEVVPQSPSGTGTPTPTPTLTNTQSSTASAKVASQGGALNP